MIEKIEAVGLPLPTLYRVDTEEEADTLKEHGIPYIISSLPITTLIKALMLPVLMRHYPGIKWRSYLDLPLQVYDTVVHVPGGVVEQGSHEEQTVSIASLNEGRDVDIADNDRTFSGSKETTYTVRLDEALKDCSAEVDPKVLSDFNLLPQFVGDIESVIRRNLYNAQWTEGYNKKLGCPIGTFSGTVEARNLIIVDISGSIPDGISSTLLTLLKTMKHMAEADIIVTGSTSMYWKADEELPDPEWIREAIGYGNESDAFYKILLYEIAGRHFGNVIVFGDYDKPVELHKFIDSERYMSEQRRRKVALLYETQIDRLMCYNTRVDLVPGYGRWAEQLAHIIEIDWQDWCKFLVK